MGLLTFLLDSPLGKKGSAEYAAKTYYEIFHNMDIGETISNVASGSGDSMMSAITSTMQSYASASQTLFQGVAYAIAVTFFLIALLELSTTERLTLEYFIKFFSKLVIAVVLISACPKLLTGINDFGNALTTLAAEVNAPSSSGSGGSGAKDVFNYTVEEWTAEFEAYVEDYGGGIGLFIQTTVFGGLMRLAAAVLHGIAYFVCISRLIELTVRGVLLPIPIALMSDDGWRGAGGRYIRRYIAVASQGVVLVLIGKVTTVIMTVASANLFTGDGVTAYLGLGNMMTMLLVAFTSVSLMFRSIGIINDAFGA